MSDTDIILRLRAERDRLASLVEKLRPYLLHKWGCSFCYDHDEPRGPCDCGLADLLTETETM